jgi:hypothetical protein
MGWTMRRPPQIFQKKNDASLASTQNSATVVAGKTGFNILSSKNLIFNPFLTQNTLKTL